MRHNKRLLRHRGVMLLINRNNWSAFQYFQGMTGMSVTRMDVQDYV